jgi:RNA polymerase sigma-70 factor (ECF subfamily)
VGTSDAVVWRHPRAACRRDDRALVVAVQGGDIAAYEELFRRHHTSVQRVCARRLRDQLEADEVAQATFVRALERIDRCIGDRRFGAWVQVIAQRLCVDVIRARIRTRPDDDPLRGAQRALNLVSDLDAGTVTEEALVRRERTERVHEALALLPDRQREVVVARHLHERTPPEIAAALGLTVGAVDSLLLRARRRLAVSCVQVLTESGGAAGSAGGGSAVVSGCRVVADDHAWAR